MIRRLLKLTGIATLVAGIAIAFVPSWRSAAVEACLGLYQKAKTDVSDKGRDVYEIGERTVAQVIGQTEEPAQNAEEPAPAPSATPSESRDLVREEDKGFAQVWKAVTALTDPRAALKKESEWAQNQLKATQESADSARNALTSIQAMKYRAESAQATDPNGSAKVREIYGAREGRLNDRLGYLNRRVTALGDQIGQLDTKIQIHELENGAPQPESRDLAVKHEAMVRDRFESSRGLLETAPLGAED